MSEDKIAFDASLEMTVAGVAKITVTGELDAAAAPLLRTAIDSAAQQNAKRLVLLAEGLEFMASAGLRALIFAKQKMGAGVEVYIVGAQAQVLETIHMTGFQQRVVLLDASDAHIAELL
jgi:anti-anti-sigma factor